MKLFAAFLSDGYKLGHPDMYADGTEVVSSNLTPRGDKIYRRSCTRYYDGKLTVIGHAGAIQEIVEMWDDFFKMDRGIAIARFKLLCDHYFGYDVITTDRLALLHKLGYLPLEIRTLDEGSKVNMGVPVLTIRNTIYHAFWLVNFIETVISNLTWKPSTAATIAQEYRAMLTDFAIRTGTPLDVVNIQAHNFADRGMSGFEDAARTGFGHAASFLGSDSLGTVMYAQQYYRAGNFVSCSVPATEHAVSTSNILRIENEIYDGTYKFKNEEHTQIFVNMNVVGGDLRLIAEIMFMYELMLKFPVGILSYVADSFDFYGLISRGLPYLKDVILRRESNGVTPGRLVIRPDSGDPLTVLCGVKVHDMPHSTQSFIDECDEAYDSLSDIADGYNNGKEEETFYIRTTDGDVIEVHASYEYERYYNTWSYTGCSARVVELTVEQRGAIDVLGEIFGFDLTPTGHKLLNDHIGLIYGDSITTTRCLSILERMDEMGFASGCAMFGIGSYTYQCVTRDTFGFAVKATYTRVNGKCIPIFKDPKTDSSKKSAKGLLYVGIGENNEPELLDNVSMEIHTSEENLLKVRFLDGQFYNMPTLDGIRAKLMV
jgi:nicotinamide phosphoribosyltransferase